MKYIALELKALHLLNKLPLAANTYKLLDYSELHTTVWIENQAFSQLQLANLKASINLNPIMSVLDLRFTVIRQRWLNVAYTLKHPYQQIINQYVKPFLLHVTLAWIDLKKLKLKATLKLKFKVIADNFEQAYHQDQLHYDLFTPDLKIFVNSLKQYFTLNNFYLTIGKVFTNNPTTKQLLSLYNNPVLASFPTKLYI